MQPTVTGPHRDPPLRQPLLQPQLPGSQLSLHCDLRRLLSHDLPLQQAVCDLRRQAQAPLQPSVMTGLHSNHHCQAPQPTSMATHHRQAPPTAIPGHEPSPATQGLHKSPLTLWHLPLQASAPMQLSFATDRLSQGPIVTLRHPLRLPSHTISANTPFNLPSTHDNQPCPACLAPQEPSSQQLVQCPLQQWPHQHAHHICAQPAPLAARPSLVTANFLRRHRLWPLAVPPPRTCPTGTLSLLQLPMPPPPLNPLSQWHILLFQQQACIPPSPLYLW